MYSGPHLRTPNVVNELSKLKKLTDKFDEYAGKRRTWSAKDWQQHPSNQTEHERLLDQAEGAMPDFVEAAHISIEAVLEGIVS